VDCDHSDWNSSKSGLSADPNNIDFESNGRSNVENSGTCPLFVPRDRYLHSTLGDNAIDVPSANCAYDLPEIGKPYKNFKLQ